MIKLTVVRTRKKTVQVTPQSNEKEAGTSTSNTSKTVTSPPKTLYNTTDLRPVPANIRIHQLDVYRTDEDNFTDYRSGESNLETTDDTEDTTDSDSEDTEEDTESDDDSTKFKLHQGEILETYSYNQLYNADFSNDYEDCTGEGKVQLKYNKTDLKKLYKGQRILLCNGRKDPSDTKTYTKTEINAMVSKREKELLAELVARKKENIKAHNESEIKSKEEAPKDTTSSTTNSKSKTSSTDSTKDSTSTDNSSSKTSNNSNSSSTATVIHYVITNQDTEKEIEKKNKLNSTGAKEDPNPTTLEKTQIHQQAVDEITQEVTGLYHSLNGWITEEKFTKDGTELSLNDYGKLLEVEDKLTYENMYRSKILEEVIKTAGLIPVVDFTDLQDDVISWTSKSSSGNDGSAHGDGSMTIDQAKAAFKSFSYGGFSTHDPTEAWNAYEKGQRSFDCYGATAWWYHVLNFKVGIIARDICYPSAHSRISGTHHTIQIKQNGSWQDPSDYYSGGNSSLGIIHSRTQDQVCRDPPSGNSTPAYVKCKWSKNT